MAAPTGPHEMGNGGVPNNYQHCVYNEYSAGYLQKLRMMLVIVQASTVGMSYWL